MDRRYTASRWPILAASILAASTLSIGGAKGVENPSTSANGPAPFAELLAAAERAQEPHYRVIYNDDAEIDGQTEFMRFMLYADDFADSLIGIVYTSSEFHYRGEPGASPPIPSFNWYCCDLPTGVNRLTTWQSIISGGGYFGQFGGYAAAYPYLKSNDPRYPTPAHLLSLVRVGNVDNVGEMTKVTPGSTLIKNALLSNDVRPLWLVTGGGSNTIAAALKQIADEYQNTAQWPTIRAHIIATTHLYLILDQDPTFKDYIRVAWPDLQATLSRFQWLPMGYTPTVTGFNTGIAENYFTASFVAQYKTGPILGAYPTATDGSWLSEGDAPMYLNLLPNGLRSEESPTFGGWGGRFAQVTSSGYSDIVAYFLLPTWTSGFGDPTGAVPITDGGSGSTSPSVQEGYPLSRWVPAIQNDMLSRSAWQTNDFAHANHPPIAFIPLAQQNITARPGDLVFLNALAADPGNHKLTTDWFQYEEAGTYPGQVQIFDPASLNTLLLMPRDAKTGQTIHLILSVTNDGAPPLTRYQRVVITCR